MISLHSAWQALADVLEAVLWERARSIAHGRAWRCVASEIVVSFEMQWPAKLCSLEHAKQIGVAIEIDPLYHRFRDLAKKKVMVRDRRARAIRVLAEAGQLSLPPDGMTLWQFFKPEQNILTNKGALV